LLTHAFFKALLFLAAGSVIHALNGEQDMREMGGLRSKIPITFWTMGAGVVAIAGIPPFAGFVSKDEILYRAFVSPGIGPVLWFVGLVTAGLTSFYMFRLYFLTFFGDRRGADEAQHSHGGHAVHESPGIMLFPLAVLAILSVIGGWVGWPQALGGGDWFGHFLEPVISASHLSFEQVSVAVNNGLNNGAAASTASAEGNSSVELILAAVSTLVALSGLFVAYLFYIRKPELPGKLAKRFSALYNLVLNKYWVDELYSAAIVRPINAFARVVLWWGVDVIVVDGAALTASGGAKGLGAIARRLQSGNIRSYAGWLAGGAAVLLLLIYFGFGSHMFVWSASVK
jgi:NADH-quinone oxidoreductase subunit L